MKESKRFVNQYEYNLDLAKEAVISWLNNKLKKELMVTTTLLIFSVFSFLITMKITVLLLCFIFISPIILFIKLKKNAVKIELERMKVLYKEDPILIKIIFDKKIYMSTSQGEKIIEISSIESFVETKNLIVLIVKGNIRISFYKNGFIEGTCEDFLLTLKQLIKTHNLLSN